MATNAPEYGQPEAPQGVRVLSSPKPLTSAEVKAGMIYRMAEAMIRTIFNGVDPLPQELLNEVVESMSRHIGGCNLNGKAYSDYIAKWTLDVTYNNFGMKIGDHFEGVVERGEVGEGAVTVHLEIEKPPTPPNLERVETEHEVPVSSAGRGTVKVKYPKPAKSSAKVTRVTPGE
jgi:hypothetical protein